MRCWAAPRSGGTREGASWTPAITHHDATFPTCQSGSGRAVPRRTAPRIAGVRARVIRGADEPAGPAIPAAAGAGDSPPPGFGPPRTSPPPPPPPPPTPPPPPPPP